MSREFEEDGLSDLIVESLNEIAQEMDEDDVGDAIREFYDDLGEVMYKETIENMDEGLAAWREELSGFRNRLYEDWQKPIDLLEAFIIYSRDFGLRLQNDVGDEAREADDVVFLSLIRLHGRAIQISQEILALIKHGFADGAHARWRALHEIAVVSMFIKTTGEETAKRFLLHELVDQYHLRKDIHEYEGTELLGEISIEDVEEARDTVDSLCEKFGDEFGGLWGWAAHEVSNPRFKDLEEAVDMNHHRPYYKFASKANVHSGAMGTTTQIGVLNRPNMSVSGPTNSGFYLPGLQTAVSLYQITIALLTHIVVAEALADVKVMDSFLDDIQHAFMAAQENINLKDKEMIDKMIEEVEENMDEFLEVYEPVDPSKYEIRIDLEEDPD